MLQSARLVPHACLEFPSFANLIQKRVVEKKNLSRKRTVGHKTRRGNGTAPEAANPAEKPVEKK
jgi:hypothetical protein